MPDSQDFDGVVFYAIYNQVWRLAYRPFASPVNMSLSSNFGMVDQIIRGFPYSLSDRFGRGRVIFGDVVLGFDQIR
jgi:hypothetical protein